MLVFVDESGGLNPNAAEPWAVLCAICLPEEHSRTFNEQLHTFVRSVYPAKDPFDMEIKAEKFLARKPFEYSAERRQLVAGILDLVERSPVAVFAVQMPRPAVVPNWPRGVMPPHFRLLTERIELHMRQTEPQGLAKILFDERDSGADAADSRSFRTFMSTTDEGRSWRHILDTPFFVSSNITPGIQVADLFAGGLRHHQQLRSANSTFASEWEQTVRRLNNIAIAKTVDYPMGGYTYYGLYFMPERYYASPPGARPLL